MQPITIIVTSCDRFDLLERTLDSFFALNKYPFVDFHVNNDSFNCVPFKLKQKYNAITWHEGVKRGLSTSWDYLISLVKTEYFFNIEDDWYFEGNPNFIEESIEILNQGYHQVWIRDSKDHQHKLSNCIFSVNYKDDYIHYKEVEKIKDWCGFTFNPSVRKLLDWLNLFPNGVKGVDEIDLSRKVYDIYQAASLVNSSCKHIGWNRHTKNFKI